MRMTISRKGKFLLRQIAVRRLKKSRETILLSLGMLFSVLLIFCQLCIGIIGQGICNSILLQFC